MEELELATAPPRDPGYLELSRDVWVSLVLVLPLLAVYQVGVLLVDFQVLNGVDFATRYVFANHGHKGVILLNLGVVATFLAAIIRLGNRGRFRAGLFVPLVLESAVYAWLLSVALTFALERMAVMGIDAEHLSASLRAMSGAGLRNAVLSVGAGVYEELVFRLVAIAVLEYTFHDLLATSQRTALLAAVCLSSLLFAAAHHIGPFGDPFDVVTFALRTGAGLVFATLYKTRSLAVAVYAHALYDLYVLVLW